MVYVGCAAPSHAARTPRPVSILLVCVFH
jgi:hypothetical protein